MREKVRFNQHPVISVLLWILGTESYLHVNYTYNNHFVDNDVQHIPHIIGTLKWKDDQGGNIIHVSSTTNETYHWESWRHMMC